MRRLIIFLCCAIGLYALKASPVGISEETVQSWTMEYIGFEPNLGQVGNLEGKSVNSVLATAKLPGYTIFITENGVSYVIWKIREELLTSQIDDEESKFTIDYARIDLDLIDASILRGKIEYQNPLPGYTNYYLPQCPDGVHGVITYQKLVIKDVYPGIDWVWKNEDGTIHHQFEITPGADIGKIKMWVKYADTEISEDGKKLTFITPLGKIVDGAIVAYTNLKTMDVSYKKEQGLISFDVKDYSGKEFLTIDPPLALVWGTYYGTDCIGLDVTCDASGNVFVAGYAVDAGFATFTYNPGGGAYYQGSFAGGADGVILKFNPSGVRLWATYYGGSNEDVINFITTDANGNLFCAGRTWSTNFPRYNPGGGAYYQASFGGTADAFILKFNNSGVRQWATYYGGSGYEYGAQIVTDTYGNIFLLGTTRSTDFPTYNPGGGAYYQGNYGGGDCDAFILKFNNSGVRQWATYFGGDSVDYGDVNRRFGGIGVNIYGNVFVGIVTRSPNLPTYNPGGGAYYQENYAGFNECFLLKFNNSGVRLWATYYGRSGSDQVNNVVPSPVNGNVFITGTAGSPDLPLYNPGGGAYFQDTLHLGSGAFILEFNDSGVMQWGTFYTSGEHWGMAIDPVGNIYIKGHVQANYLYTYNPGGGAYYQGQNGGTYWLEDAFILSFSNSRALRWSTFYGGSKNDWGYSIATDNSGNVYAVGYTSSFDLPKRNPGGGAWYQDTFVQYQDMVIYITKFESPLTGIKEDSIPAIKTLLRAYVPTFFKNQIILRFLNLPTAPIRILIYNCAGMLVYESPYLKPENTVTVEGEGIARLPKGVYFLKVYSGKKEISGAKIIKE